MKEELMKDESNLLSTVTHKGKWMIDDELGLSIDCYVMDDMRRVLSLRGTARAIGLRGGGSGALLRVLNSQWMQPYLTTGLYEWKESVEHGTIQLIQTSTNRKITPFDCELFVDLCKIYVQAKNDGVFDGTQWEGQSETADRMLKIMSVFAKVGIVALIDEITGYQEEREKDELQKLLSKYISEEFLPWAKRFPDEFYMEICRLKGWEYKGRPKPPIIGKITNYLVYEQLPEGILEELQAKNPKDVSGNRKKRHHQLLTLDTGVPHLDKHLAQVIALMRASDSWNEFDRLFRKSYHLDTQSELAMDKE